MINIDYLRQIVSYDAGAGVLTWLKRPETHFSSARICNSWNAKHAGKAAGAIRPSGYVYLAIDGIRHPVHRVAYALHNNEWPPHECVIDHIDQDPSNNRIVNLRLASQKENMRNQPSRKNNSSGTMGVSFDKKQGKWVARIMVSGKSVRLGAFEIQEDAINARRLAERRLGFHQNHGRSKTDVEIDRQYNAFMSSLKNEAPF